MKKLSKRTKILLSLISFVLILSVGIGVALSLISYKDPVDQAPVIQPLGDYDYSKRPFFSNASAKIYKGDIYWVDPCFFLRWTPLSAFVDDFNSSDWNEWPDPPRGYYVCGDETHNHGLEDPTVTCLGYKTGGFLIDAYESAGETPIIYRGRYVGFEASGNAVCGEIIRYDTGNQTDEVIVSTSDNIEYMMAYDQWLFFMTVNADGVYSINVISKKGGDITSLEVGKHGWNFMWANDDYIYYQDSAGNIYRATLDLKNPEFIYYAESIAAMEPDYIGTFIHGNYLYFESDYELIPYSEGISVDGSMVINFAKHSIRRVPLDDLYGESELVAENVLDNYVFGVGNNILYYQPCIMGEWTSDDYYFNWTGGQLRGVDLDTLEPAEIVNDIGLDINGQTGYVQGNILFAVEALPTDDRYYMDRYSGMGNMIMVLDTISGSLYPFAGKVWFG